MTNEKELEWYEQEPYMTRGPYKDYYHFDKIVAEATRLGEMKAWEEIKAKRDSMDTEGSQSFVDSYRMSWRHLGNAIDAKLTSLKTP